MSKIKIIKTLLILIVLSSLVNSFSLSDQGTGVRNSSSGELVDGDLRVLIYDSLVGGNLLFDETFTGVVVNGSWNVMLDELDLEYGKEYFKDYSINGENVNFTNSSGGVSDRMSFYSSMGNVSSEDIVNEINFTRINFIDVFFDNLVSSWLKLSGNLNVTGSVVSSGQNVCLEDGTNCPAGLSGDITSVNTDGDYLSGGVLSGDVNLYLNESRLNETIDARDSDTTYSNLSEFVNDVGYINGTINWSNVSNVPINLLDGDNDTTYSYSDWQLLNRSQFTSLSNFTDDINAINYWKNNSNVLVYGDDINITGNISVYGMKVKGHIVPILSSNFNLGSNSSRFEAIYANELFLSNNSLYLDGTKVLSSDASTMNFNADSNQNMQLMTSGSGNLQFTSTGSGQIQFTSATNINLDPSNEIYLEGNVKTLGGNILLDDVVEITGNLGVGKSPAVALDVDGQVNAQTICDENGNQCKDISTGWSGGGGTSGVLGSLPIGAVIFYNGTACPDGFEKVEGAKGRYLVGLQDSGTLEGEVGTALSNLENRSVGLHSHGKGTLEISESGSHTHTASPTGGTVVYSNAPGTDFDPLSGNTNNRVGITVDSATHSHSNSDFSGNTANSGTVAGTNAPYVQYLVCVKVSNTTPYGLTNNEDYLFTSNMNHSFGIGTNSPTAKLEVNGSVKITDNITLGNKIRFFLGTVLREVSDKLLQIDSSVNVTGNLSVHNLLKLGKYNTSNLDECNFDTLGSMVFDLDEDRPYVCTNDNDNWTWKPLDSDYDKDGIVDWADQNDSDSNVLMNNTRACVVGNGTGIETWNGEQWINCVPESCFENYHIEGDRCVDDVVSCNIENGTGTKTWNGSAYENCTVISCDTDYFSINNETCEPARTSCNQHLIAGHNISGTYWLDIDGGDSSNAFEAYCDMETDGGGWTLVYVVGNNGGTDLVVDNSNNLPCMRSGLDPSSNDWFTSCGDSTSAWISKSVSGTSYMFYIEGDTYPLVARFNTNIAWFSMQDYIVSDSQFVDTYWTNDPSTTFNGYSGDASSASGCQDSASNTGYEFVFNDANSQCGASDHHMMGESGNGAINDAWNKKATLWVR